MQGVTYAKGVAAASVAVGPLFILSIFITSALWDAGDLGKKVLLLLPALFFALPLGLLLSFLPNFLGTALLAWTGRGNVGVRFWPVWAMAGAGLGWAIDWAAALTGGSGGSGTPGPMFALVGIPCALICRWGTRWSD